MHWDRWAQTKSSENCSCSEAGASGRSQCTAHDHIKKLESGLFVSYAYSFLSNDLPIDIEYMTSW